MPSGLLRQSRTTILLSINAAAILIAGVLISSAIWLNGGVQFRVVGERSDIVEGDIEAEEVALVDSVTTSDAELSSAVEGLDEYDLISTASYEQDLSEIADGELWNEKSIVIYATPDADICINGTLAGLGEMYWQTSNTNVIAGFYDSARTWLGYSAETCRYPVIAGTGTTVITAGTYDGKRKDSITVTVVEPSSKTWEREVLSLVNKIRVKNGLSTLAWGATCEDAADIRAEELETLYSHTRPDGSSWSTACPTPASGGTSGENLAIGNAAVSPATVVSLWMNSSSHRANILNPDYTNLAVGFLYDPDAEYKTHWSQEFSTY